MHLGKRYSLKTRHDILRPTLLYTKNFQDATVCQRSESAVVALNFDLGFLASAMTIFQLCCCQYSLQALPRSTSASHLRQSDNEMSISKMKILFLNFLRTAKLVGLLRARNHGLSETICCRLMPFHHYHCSCYLSFPPACIKEEMIGAQA